MLPHRPARGDEGSPARSRAPPYAAAAMAAPDPLPPTVHVACTGPFHLDAPGPALARRVLAGELAVRLPDAAISWWAPAPRSPSARLDPLPAPRVGDPLAGPARRDAGHPVDLVVQVATPSGAPEGFAPEELLLLVPEHVPAALRAQRRAYLTAVGALRAPDGHLDLGETSPVVLPDDATADDLVASIEGASLVRTADPAVAAIAASFGVQVDGPIPPTIAPDAVRARLDEAARRAVAAAAARIGIDVAALEHARARHFAAEVAAGRTAHLRVGERAALARQRLAEALHDALQENDRLREELTALRGSHERAEHLDRELRAVYATKTFRATAWARRWYARIRGRR